MISDIINESWEVSDIIFVGIIHVIFVGMRMWCQYEIMTFRLIEVLVVLLLVIIW